MKPSRPLEMLSTFAMISYALKLRKQRPISWPQTERLPMSTSGAMTIPCRLLEAASSIDRPNLSFEPLLRGPLAGHGERRQTSLGTEQTKSSERRIEDTLTFHCVFFASP